MLSVVPRNGVQPPAPDISRYFSVPLCTSKTARSLRHGCVTWYSVTPNAPVAVGPPGGAATIDEP